MAKITSFDYTDAKGKKSSRTVLVLANPNDKLSCIDMSELEPTDQGVFVLEYEKIHTEYLNKLTELQAEHDLNHKYRQFFPEKMENRIDEEI